MDKVAKKPKKKGPIRFEAVVPITLIIVLTGLYFKFFFDGHLRKGLEFTGTYVHGAEVNISGITTSVLGASFELRGLQVTDKEAPERNLVQIGKIRFEFLWDALLRAKFVVNDATIENIQAYSPRKSPGKVTPPEETENNAMAQVQDNVLETTKDEFNDNVLGDVANVLDGVDPDSQLKKVQGNLKAEAKVKALQNELKEKEKAWKERIDKLPQKAEIKKLEGRMKKLKFDSKNPLQFAADLKELKKIVKEADKVIKDYKKTSKDIKTDVGRFDKEIKGLDKIVDQDIKDLRKHFGVPELDAGAFSKNLFGRMFSEKLAGLQKYMEIGRQYMPPKKSAEEKQPEVIPRKRGDGKNFHFPITKGYPLFWLKYAKISSEPNESEYSGRLSGEIKDVTSHPVQLGRPALVSLKGDFPKQQIFGLDALVTIDHTTDQPEEKLEAVVKSFPVGEQKISDSEDVKLILTKATGGSKINALMKDRQITASVKNSFTELSYDLDAKSGTVKKVLDGVMKGIPVITMDAKARGSWSDLDLSIRSNLGDELSKGFKKQIDAQVKEMEDKLKNFVNDKIKKEKAKLTGDFKKSQGAVTKKIDEGRKELETAKKTAQNSAKKKQSSSKKKGKKELEKAGKQLLKGLGF